MSMAGQAVMQVTATCDHDRGMAAVMAAQGVGGCRLTAGEDQAVDRCPVSLPSRPHPGRSDDRRR
jgi:hypothetical protein